MGCRHFQHIFSEVRLRNIITINGNKIYRPNNFSPQREDVYASEYTTCTGKIIADLVGWRYSELTMEWGTLPEEQLKVLLNMRGETNLVFVDADGQTHTEKVIRTSAVSTGTRFTGADGKPAWKDVKVEVKFINAHNN